MGGTDLLGRICGPSTVETDRTLPPLPRREGGYKVPYLRGLRSHPKGRTEIRPPTDVPLDRGGSLRKGETETNYRPSGVATEATGNTRTSRAATPTGDPTSVVTHTTNVYPLSVSDLPTDPRPGNFPILNLVRGRVGTLRFLGKPHPPKHLPFRHKGPPTLLRSPGPDLFTLSPLNTGLRRVRTSLGHPPSQ